MKKHSIYPCFLIVLILTIGLITGCGGGSGSGVIPDNTSPVNTTGPTSTPGTLVQVPGSPTNPTNTVPSNVPKGTFNVTVQFPGAKAGGDMKELTGSALPYNSHTLRVTITGEAITTPVVGSRDDLDPSGAGTYTLTVPNVPVGLNTALIEVLDPSGNTICQRKHGFYMTPGATEGPGLIILGAGIESDGSYVPQNIDIPAGTTLSFQNHDYDNDRTASMNTGSVTVGPIGHATHITQPVTAEIFPAENHLFDTPGVYNYDGQSGRILVYGLPTLTSVTTNKDPNNTTSTVNFTLTGTNFGTSRESVNGEVRFIQVQSDLNNPWGTVYNVSNFTSWSNNTTIQGTIELPGGKYRIEVSAHGENTAENVFFYKGSGNYEVIVGDPPEATFPFTAHGAILQPYEDKYYRLNINGNFYFHADMNYTYTMGDLDLYLYDPNLSLIASSESTNNNEVIDIQLVPGTYYVRIYGYNGATGSYNISMDTDENAPNAPELFTFWTKKNSGTSSNLTSVKFADGATGWVTGEGGTVLKTTNGGTNWNTVNLNTTDKLTVCYAKGNNVVIATADGQTLYKSTDGGNNWNTVSTGKNNVGFAFGDMNTAWCIENYDTVSKSVNGGETWNTVNTGIFPYLYGLFPYNGTITWVMGDGGVAVTTDGTDWTQTLTNNYTCGWFISSTEGFAGGWGAKLNYTDNGGNTWTTLSSGLDGSDAIFGLMAVDGNYLWIQNSNGNIYRSSDRAGTWTNIGRGFNAWYVIDANNGWAVWNNGAIYKYEP